MLCQGKLHYAMSDLSYAGLNYAILELRYIWEELGYAFSDLRQFLATESPLK